MPKRTRIEGRKLRHKRVRGKVQGSPDRPRMCAFISNRQVYTQIIDDTKGHTLLCASTLDPELKEEAKGKTMTEAAKLVGARIAKLAKEAGIEKIVFDKNGYKYGKRLTALADAAREGGLAF